MVSQFLTSPHLFAPLLPYIWVYCAIEKKFVRTIKAGEVLKVHVSEHGRNKGQSISTLYYHIINVASVTNAEYFTCFQCSTHWLCLHCTLISAWNHKQFCYGQKLRKFSVYVEKKLQCIDNRYYWRFRKRLQSFEGYKNGQNVLHRMVYLCIVTQQ